MTAGPAVTRGRVPAAGGDGPADIGAIRRCDTLLDLAARRRLDGALTGRDPALAVLSALAADVDGAGAVTGPARRALTRRAVTRHVAARRTPVRPHQATVASFVTGALAAVTLAVAAAGATGVVAVSLLARLARLAPGLPAGPASRRPGPRPPARPAARAPRHRRTGPARSGRSPR